MLTAAKTSLTILMKSFILKQNWQLLDGEMLIRTLPTNLLQSFCKIFLNSKVIVKSIIDSTQQFLEELLSINGLNALTYFFEDRFAVLAYDLL